MPGGGAVAAACWAASASAWREDEPAGCQLARGSREVKGKPRRPAMLLTCCENWKPTLANARKLNRESPLRASESGAASDYGRRGKALGRGVSDACTVRGTSRVRGDRLCAQPPRFSRGSRALRGSVGTQRSRLMFSPPNGSRLSGPPDGGADGPRQVVAQDYHGPIEARRGGAVAAAC